MRLFWNNFRCAILMANQNNANAQK